ncbi:uncharacterized protein LOC114297348 isoform X6 [Camellia sinensis]|uniref:uncharacterized protein LOC114297348 isoform X6 n=1 Tax=Camellia sinensis TaxID=4442 RepID=UPI001035CE3B|nr:uncharacterized protein LOC114297348 isoform X6 [Camellia sinensis]
MKLSEEDEETSNPIKGVVYGGVFTHFFVDFDELEADDLVKQLSEPFTPEDAFMFGPHSVLDLDHIQTTANFIDTLPFDGDFPAHFMAEDDVTSESSVADLSQFIPKMPAVPSMCHIISVGKLVESELYCIAHAYLFNLACEMKTILVLFYCAFEKVVVFRRSR